MSIKLEREDGNVLTTASIGDPGTVLFKGDYGPASFYEGAKKVAGFETPTLTGRGQVGWEAPYKAELPSVAVKGEGEQEKLTGKNLAKEVPKVGPFSDVVYLDKEIHAEAVTISFITKNMSYQNETAAIFAFFDSNDNPRYITWHDFAGAGGQGETFSGFCHATLHDVRFIRLLAYTTGMSIISGEFTNFQVELAPTPTPYEPYCGGIPAPNPQYPIEPQFLADISVASRSRNLFDSELVPDTVVAGGVTLVNNHDGSFTANGTATDDYSHFYYADITDKLVDGAFYTSYNSSAKVILGLEMFDKKSQAFVSFNTSPIKVDKVHYTYYVSFQLGDKKVVGTVEDEVAWPQIVASKVKEPYEPYYDGGTAPLPILRALPDGSVRDEIDVVTGTVTRRIWEKVLNGSEHFTKLGDNWIRKNNFGCYFGGHPASVGKGALVGPALSNALTPNIWEFTRPNTQLNNVTASGPYLYITVANEYTGITGTDAETDKIKKFAAYFKSKFDDGTPVTIWYALANPIIEHYDPAILRQHPGYTQLIQQGGFREAEIEAKVYKEMA